MPLIFKKKFQKSYDKLPSDIRSHCDERVRIFVANPFAVALNNHLLHGEYAGCRSINVTGDYRALYFEQEGAAIFIAIGTHHELFGK